MCKMFVCSPYRGDIRRNTSIARQLCRDFALAGYIPIAPHLIFPQFLDEDSQTERELGICAGIALMQECAEMYVYKEDGISEGMRIEIDMAEKLDVKITYSKPVDKRHVSE